MTTFSSPGDLGDTVYQLCTLRLLLPPGERADLVLYRTEGMVREAWTPAKVERVRSFFEAQEYIGRVRHGEHAEGIDLNGWRQHHPRGRRNLADHCCDAFGVPHWPRETPWAAADRREHAASVVLHRSPRYHGRGFPWRDIVARWGPDAVFVGGSEEHAAFTAEFGPVRYLHLPTLIDLARVIAGAKLFIGNQSAPRAVAESLKVPVWVEEGRPPNTHWRRRHAWYAAADAGRIFARQRH